MKFRLLLLFVVGLTSYVMVKGQSEIPYWSPARAYISNCDPCSSPVNVPLYATICQGESYNEYGFSLPLHDVPGSYTYSHPQKLTDVNGCDSVVTLYLTVRPLEEEILTARVPVNKAYDDNGFFVPAQSEPGFFIFENQYNDGSACKSSTTLHLTVYVEIIPDEYFTPEQGGQNNFWDIKNIEYFEVVTVDIYDRFGKLLLRQSGSFTPWDGNYLGNPCPSTDYWYVVTLKEIDKQYMGHFTLLRR